MSAAFTPGPWKASIHQTLEDAREDSSFDWLHGHGDEAKFLPLGCVWKDTGTGLTGLPGHVETTAANARLIAAAPCMAGFIKKCADAGDAEAIALWERINASS